MQKTLFGMLVLLLFTRVASAQVVAPARETHKIEGAHDSCGTVVFLRCNSADVDQTDSLRPPQASQSFTGSLASHHHFNRRVFIAGISLLAASKAADAIATRQLLDRGGWENNPLFGRHPLPAKQSLINLGFFAAESIAFYLTEHNRHRWVRWTGRVLLAHAVVEHTQLAACNAGIDTRAPRVHNCKTFLAVPEANAMTMTMAWLSWRS